MYPKLYRLIKSLAERTKRNQLIWEAAEDKTTFTVSFPNYSIKLETIGAPEDGLVTYGFSVINEFGDVLEYVLSDPQVPRLEYFDLYNVLADMYEAARRKALGVEDALNDILISLGELPDDDIPF